MIVIKDVRTLSQSSTILLEEGTMPVVGCTIFSTAFKIFLGVVLLNLSGCSSDRCVVSRTCILSKQSISQLREASRGINSGCLPAGRSPYPFLVMVFPVYGYRRKNIHSEKYPQWKFQQAKKIKKIASTSFFSKNEASKNSCSTETDFFN